MTTEFPKATVTWECSMIEVRINSILEIESDLSDFAKEQLRDVLGSAIKIKGVTMEAINAT